MEFFDVQAVLDVGWGLASYVLTLQSSRLQGSLLPPLVEWRSPIVIALELLPSGECIRPCGEMMLKKLISSIGFRIYLRARFLGLWYLILCFWFWYCVVRSESIRRALSCWSGSFHSRGLFVKLLRTSRFQTCSHLLLLDAQVSPVSGSFCEVDPSNYICFKCLAGSVFYLVPGAIWSIWVFLLLCADRSSVPEPCCPCPPGGSWGLPCGSVWGYQLVCNPCQEGDNYAQGYPACTTDQRGESLSCVSEEFKKKLKNQ